MFYIFQTTPDGMSQTYNAADEFEAVELLAELEDDYPESTFEVMEA